MVPDSDIAELLGRNADPQAVAELLVKAALAGGGEDNVTVVVVYVLADGEESADGGQGAGRFADQILFGPSDRGALVAGSLHRGRRAGAAVRERLSRRNLPSLRPVGARAGGDVSVAGELPVSEDTPAPEIAPAPEGASLPGVAPAVAEAPASPPSPRRKRRRRRLFLIVAILLLVVVLAVAGFAAYNSTVYYVGTYADGTVALYRGLPGSVLGIDLSSPVELGTVTYDSLAPYLRERIDTHDLVSKEDGQLFLRTLGPQQ
jgi:protein phosphatase